MSEQANSVDGFFVFEVSECDWIVARSVDEAAAFYRSQLGEEADEYMHDVIEPMTADELSRHTFTDADDGSKRSFMAELVRLGESGHLKTGYFATTEY